MSTVFISYRRQTAAGEARALFSDLVARLGQSAVFMDVDSISLGRDFRSELQKTLAACDLMLVLIDKDWAAAKDETGRIRLENAGDFVRMEIEAALKRDIAVTPVLVKGAQMPAAQDLPAEISDLAYRNGFELSHNRWESDVREMIRRLSLDVAEQGRQVETDRRPIALGEAGGESVPKGAKPRVDRGPTPTAPRQVLAIAGVLGVICLGGIATWLANRKPEPDRPQATAAQTLPALAPPAAASCATRQGYPLGRWGASVGHATQADYSDFITFTEPSSGTWLPSSAKDNGKGTFKTSVTPAPGKEVVLTSIVARGPYTSTNDLVVSADGCSMEGTFLDSENHQGEVTYRWQGDKP